jgi:alpha-1,3-rhamnosyltransferase
MSGIDDSRLQQPSVGAEEHSSFISVCVPSYNHSTYVEKCLRSIFHQSRQPDELIVIDDGSRDDSPKVIERVLKDSPVPSELIVRSNKGLSATLNEGLSRSRGDYFAYLGSDDFWLPELLGDRVTLLKSRPDAALAYGHAFVVDEHDLVRDCSLQWNRYVDGDVREMLLHSFAPASPTVVYRREAVARHGWNEGAQLEDYELYLRLSAEASFALSPRALSAWRQHGRNTSDDAKMMLRELLAAQRSVAGHLGLSERDLASSQRRTRFALAENFLHTGDRARAISLSVAAWRGAPTWTALARRTARLATPAAVLEWRAERLRKRARARYVPLV